ncbi:hypothetical protein PV02_05480 [Methanolobus chelungpuianus]|uniref:UPF0292 protein PV02_05480 n=1 Tax=Methanolobus chelungpuianus TaxID=502115 RepID=A0AAE3HAL1_9EURY|nr:hypothetical protein [Methanolobus chelungpuianus]
MQVYERRLENIEELLAELVLLAEENAVLIVEGKRDIQALNRLGVKGHFEIATQRSLSNFCESIARLNEKVIILTDWDRRGNLLMLKMTKHFQSFGITPNTLLRERLMSIVQKEIKDVESLHTFVVKLRQATGHSTSEDGFVNEIR